MRFSDDTTIHQFLSAVEPVLARLEERGELTRAQESFGSACAVAQARSESQTAYDLLAWAHGQTPEGCVEAARAESLEAWIAPEDMPLALAL